MSEHNNKILQNKSSIGKAILFFSLLFCSFLFVNNIASSSVRTGSSLVNIDWGMSPDEVLHATKDYSRDARLIEKEDRAILIQRERITDSDIASKSEVHYSFINGKLQNIKITKSIKHWPDYILEQLLYKTVYDYEMESAFKTLIEGNIYKSENTDEHKAIFLEYDDSNNPKYAYVELKAKT